MGIFSGAIGKVLSSRQTIYTALSMIFLSLVIAALGLNLHIAVLICAIVLFASGFALMYAPLVNTALINITAAKSGIAIGFYNLTINITIPLGIAYTAKLMDLSFGYSTILLVLAGIALVGAAIYVLADRRMSSAERARGVYVA